MVFVVCSWFFYCFLFLISVFCWIFFLCFSWFSLVFFLVFLDKFFFGGGRTLRKPMAQTDTHTNGHSDSMTESAKCTVWKTILKMALRICQPFRGIQGDIWEVTIVILLWRIEKCLNWTNKKSYSRVYIGRFDYLP